MPDNVQSQRDRDKVFENLTKKEQVTGSSQYMIEFFFVVVKGLFHTSAYQIKVVLIWIPPIPTKALATLFGCDWVYQWVYQREIERGKDVGSVLFGVSKNLQQGRAGGEGTGYRGDNTCQKSQETRYNLAPGSFFVNRFWGRRPDGVAINEVLKIVYILEFEWSTDRDKGFLEVKDAEANEQHKSIIGVLKAAAPEWEFEHINFVLANRGSVVESACYTKLTKLDIQEGKKDKLFADHATQVCKAHNRVIVSFLQQVQGGTRGIEGEHWA